MERTKLFLDVDGVVNHWPASTMTDLSFKSAKCMGYSINYYPEVWESLANLPVDIHWLTTWVHHANEYISPLIGYPDLPVIGAEVDVDFSSSYWWKLNLLKEMELTEPFIWIDDDLDYYENLVYNSWDSIPYPHLLISPKGSFNAKDLEKVSDFLAKD